MTKYRDLDETQRSAFKEVVLRGLERRILDDHTYSNQAIRLLLLANGAGLALLGAFAGAVAGAVNPISALVAPLWKFLLGAVSAALIYFPLAAVAAQGVKHAADQAQKFFLNQIELESMQGWALNARGRVVVSFLCAFSISFFAWAVVQCIHILNSL